MHIKKPYKPKNDIIAKHNLLQGEMLTIYRHMNCIPTMTKLIVATILENKGIISHISPRVMTATEKEILNSEP